MKFFFAVFIILATVAWGDVSRAQTAGASEGLATAASMLQEHHMSMDQGPALTREEAERIALAENPEIEVAARRVAVAEAHVPVAGALDDPMAMYRGWGVPLQQPWNYNAAQNMFSISETLPGRGKRDLRTSVAESDVDVAKAELDQVRLEVRVRVRKAFADFLRVNDEMRIHDEHLDIARQAIEAARIKYTTGKVPQQDILKAQVALTRLAEHMIQFDHDASLARARMNTLLGGTPRRLSMLSANTLFLRGCPRPGAWTMWPCNHGPICSQPVEPPTAAAKNRRLRRRLTCLTSRHQRATCSCRPGKTCGMPTWWRVR